jgi:hypothetical protein
MTKKWQDPLEVPPPKNTLVEVVGIPFAGRPLPGSKNKEQVHFREYRAAAFMGDDEVWYLPEIQTSQWIPLENVFSNEVYRWRDLTPCKDCY